jgi:hypothetical protein
MQEAAKAMGSVSAYVIGVTSAETGWLTALKRQGYDEREWYRTVGPQMAESAIDPALTEVYLEQLGKDPDEARVENFVYGLDLMLDSLQVRLTAKLAVDAEAQTAASQ